MLRLTTIEELERYPFPDLTLPDRHQHLAGEVRDLHQRGLFAIGFMDGTIFEIAWHMRGMEELFDDLAFNPPFAKYLLDRITEIRCGQARLHAGAGVDMLKIGDDMGTQLAMFMSPAMYSTMVQTPARCCHSRRARDSARSSRLLS